METNMKQIIADMESIEECVKEQMKNLIEITKHEVNELSCGTQISQISLKIGETRIDVSSQNWTDGRTTNPSVTIFRLTDESRVTTGDITIFPDENNKVTKRTKTLKLPDGGKFKAVTVDVI